jgi:hypothetical protein
MAPTVMLIQMIRILPLLPVDRHIAAAIQDITTPVPLGIIPHTSNSIILTRLATGRTLISNSSIRVFAATTTIPMPRNISNEGCRVRCRHSIHPQLNSVPTRWNFFLLAYSILLLSLSPPVKYRVQRCRFLVSKVLVSG